MFYLTTHSTHLVTVIWRRLDVGCFQPDFSVNEILIYYVMYLRKNARDDCENNQKQHNS